MSDTSDCSVCPLPAPVTIQISEQESTSSYQSDGYLCIDSEDEQDIKTSTLNNNSKVLSGAKQLLDYDIFSSCSVTSATQDTDTLPLASTVTVSVDSECDSTATPQFSEILARIKIDDPMEDSEQLDPTVKLRQQTPATIAIANTIGAVRSRNFLKVLLDLGSVWG